MKIKIRLIINWWGKEGIRWIQQFVFLGAGSFGTALAVMLGKKGLEVNIWHRKNNIVEDINIKKENIKYLPKVVIPAGIKAYNEIEKKYTAM